MIFVSAGSCNRSSSADEIRAGIVAVAEAIGAKQPQAAIFVLKLLPCGHGPNKRRELVAAVNQGLDAALAAVPKAKALDVDPGFICSLPLPLFGDVREGRWVQRRRWARSTCTTCGTTCT